MSDSKQSNKALTGRLLRCLWLVLVLAILLSTASYAWFSLSRTPSVSDMSVFIANVDGLELSTSADAPDEEWSQELNFSEILANSAALRPVTWSEANQAFYTATYGTDGRIADLDTRLTDEINSTQGSGDTYYIKLTFYARTGQPVSVNLSPATTRLDGTEGYGTYLYGTPVWNEETISHDNAGGGSELALRMGFRITLISEDGTTSDPVFYIYEPNCDTHVSGETGYLVTPSADGTETLVPVSRLIRQTTSLWTETYPVERGVISRTLGEFLDDTTLFQIMPTQIAQIDLYIWLEGMDADCVNEIGEDNQITANIQFSVTQIGQGGMTDIDDWKNGNESD